MPSYSQEAHARFAKQVERSVSNSRGTHSRSYGGGEPSYGPIAKLLGLVVYVIYKTVIVAIYTLAALFAYFLVTGEWPALLQNFAQRYL